VIKQTKISIYCSESSINRGHVTRLDMRWWFSVPRRARGRGSWHRTVDGEEASTVAEGDEAVNGDGSLARTQPTTTQGSPVPLLPLLIPLSTPPPGSSMGRSSCCEQAHTNKGAWTKEEDQHLIAYIKAHGEGCWRWLPKAAGNKTISCFLISR
jgi:hypothetical protein